MNRTLSPAGAKTAEKHEHTHEHTHEHHGHVHSEEERKAVYNRLAKATGHLDSIKRMVLDGRDCSEILIQLAAVRSAINNTGKVILKSHLEHCIVDAVRNEDLEKISDLKEAIDLFIK